MTAASFYAPAPEIERAEDTFDAYLTYLRARNGDLDAFDRREARMAEVFDHSAVRADLRLDPERFDRNYVRFTEPDVSPEELALLAFVKINAGEAYGVDVMSAARQSMLERAEPAFQVERVLLREEQYHTRLLVGATQHFEALQVGGAWKPSWPLRLLVGGLARLPEAVFHPVLLGAEIAGVYAFNWLLGRLGTLFPNDAAVRESMEQRLVEVLVDEVGHIAFNRVLVGSLGRSVAARVARLVTEGHRVMSRELGALGLDEAALAGVERFDYRQLPQDVRARAFFA